MTAAQFRTEYLQRATFLRIFGTAIQQTINRAPETGCLFAASRIATGLPNAAGISTQTSPPRFGRGIAPCNAVKQTVTALESRPGVMEVMLLRIAMDFRRVKLVIGNHVGDQRPGIVVPLADHVYIGRSEERMRRWGCSRCGAFPCRPTPHRKKPPRPTARLPLSSPPPRQDRNRHSPGRMRKPKRGVGTGQRSENTVCVCRTRSAAARFSASVRSAVVSRNASVSAGSAAFHETRNEVRSPSEKVGAAEAGSGGACFALSQVTSSAPAMTGMRKVRCSPNRTLLNPKRFSSLRLFPRIEPGCSSAQRQSKTLPRGPLHPLRKRVGDCGSSAKGAFEIRIGTRPMPVRATFSVFRSRHPKSGRAPELFGGRQKSPEGRRHRRNFLYFCRVKRGFYGSKLLQR